MSIDSFAILRNSLGPDLAALAEQHMQHDLLPSDRQALQSAATTVSTYTSLGSAVGLSLGLFFAFRLRRARFNLFASLRSHPTDRPVALKFSDGREQALPDLTSALKPSLIGGFATYTLLGAGGLFLGGETGLLSGTFMARSRIGKDRESRERIQRAFRRFQADALRTQANLLDGDGETGRFKAWGL